MGVADDGVERTTHAGHALDAAEQTRQAAGADHGLTRRDLLRLGMLAEAEDDIFLRFLGHELLEEAASNGLDDVQPSRGGVRVHADSTGLGAEVMIVKEILRREVRPLGTMRWDRHVLGFGGVLWLVAVNALQM